jgi:hypothetical protein
VASEKEANLAREQSSDFLREHGAHAIAVDEVSQKGGKTFAVVAFFEKKPEGIPEVLEVKSGKAKLQVPLVARVMEKFRPE